jgi:hypothetical protein
VRGAEVQEAGASMVFAGMPMGKDILHATPMTTRQASPYMHMHTPVQPHITHIYM